MKDEVQELRERTKAFALRVVSHQLLAIFTTISKNAKSTPHPSSELTFEFLCNTIML